MTHRLTKTASAAVLSLLGAWELATKAESAEAVAFAVAKVHFEQNATDGDMEAVFEIKAGDDGLDEITVVSPDGRTVIHFNAPDSSTLGIKQFRFESPEPTDATSLKAAYPEGAYEFFGKSAGGARLVGRSTLNHRLPAIARLTGAIPAGEAVSVRDFVVTWDAVAGIASYILELRQAGLKANILVALPATSTSFAVPNGFLAPGTEYDIGIGTVDSGGNISFVETTFTTGT